MRIGLVIGSTVATIKDEALHGRKLLIFQETDPTGTPAGPAQVAIDTVSAGTGDLVLVTGGSSAQRTVATREAPVDAVIVGVIDTLEVNGSVTFRKG
ncbi:MAG: EutN/CcmL family microcompartment protein [Deltaproteobacteria bacterium]|nr:EutN/CcmL family microcompartment protein [Deltaproteobacteria bacterium]